MNEIRVRPILFVFFVAIGSVSLVTGVFLSSVVAGLGGINFYVADYQASLIIRNAAIMTVAFWILAAITYYMDRYGFPKPKK